MSLLLQSDPLIPDQGGVPLVVRLDTAFAVGALVRMRLGRAVVIDGTGQIESFGECLSGQPGTALVAPDTGLPCYPLTPFPADRTDPLRGRFVRAYSPRLAPGVYWLGLWYSTDQGASWAVGPQAIGPFRVMLRTRDQEVYEIRANFPTPPNTGVGPQTLAAEPQGS